MIDKKSELNRRQILKFVMIGGVATAVVMPSKWIKPLVNAVIPPAHAAASAPATTKAPGTTTAASTTPAPGTTAAAGTTARPAPGTTIIENGHTVVYNANGTVTVDGSITGTSVTIDGVTYP